MNTPTPTAAVERVALEHCPFCGSGAQLRQCEDEDSENFGGYFVECIVCHASTDLTFSCGEDARPLVIEKWNRRASPQRAGLARGDGGCSRKS